MKNGALTDIASAGAIIWECFCGPCFGAGDTPANGEFSIRHTTWNFPNREGSKPGDGSAREQATSCQRVLGAAANLALEYATKQYRSNCINWGMAPLLVKNGGAFTLGDYVFVPGIRKAILKGVKEFDAYVVKPDGAVNNISVSTGDLTPDKRQIIADGCLINYYRNH